MPGACVPSTQKAVVTPEMGEQLNLHLRTVAVRDPSPGEAVVRILYSGICRSDACFSVGPEPGFPEHNHIAGHEGLGHIVKAHDPSLLGRPVAIRYLGTSCQTCTYCLRGLFTSCPFQLNAPKHIAGTFQQYATVPTSCLIPLPKSVLSGSVNPALYAAALCSGSTALVALQAAEISPGDVVMVVGVAGAIGHLTGAIAKQVKGAKVIGIDLGWKIDKLQARSEEFADIFLHAPTADDGEAWSAFKAELLGACSQLRGRNGLTRAAEAVVVTSSSIAAFKRLDEYVCDGGRIVCVGVPQGRNSVSVDLNALIERNLKLSGNLMGGHRGAAEVMHYITSGQIKPHITEVALEDVPEQMHNLVDCKTMGKVVVRVNEPLLAV
ncbi:chaperonin 10-like protein [Ilyonectria robusta]|uniref:chaperonin 10-like protein n=1 Tax=Ilyonectria robusta TaxID=1079257 RepID=UPI001E8D3FFD|nr:chaperonin 10-like protein [Ilyonectria robusta]KAH8667696.1 chaperonin 10-like protein [Ilyonectria robusta]